MKKSLYIFMFLLLVACAETSSERPKANYDTETLKRLARNIKNGGDVQAAAQLEAQIISLEPNKPDSFINLANSLVSLNQTQEAINVLVNGEEKNPQSEEIKLSLAKRLIEDNNADTGLKKLEEIKNLKNKEFFNAKGVAYDMLNNYEEAQKAYSEGLKNHPEDGLLLNNMALSYVLNREYKKGIDILEKLVKRPKYNHKYRQNLALAYGLNKQDKKALRILLKEMPRELAEENIEYYRELRK